MNLCTSCGLDFTGLRDFDAHRVGAHAYTYSDGLEMEPIREDGRRCLEADELNAAGWFCDRHGRWSHPSRRRAQKRGYALRQSPQNATEDGGRAHPHTLGNQSRASETVALGRCKACYLHVSPGATL